MTEKQDIFDKIMHLPIINFFEPFYKQHKEILLYLFFGGLTFLVSIGSYGYLSMGLHMNELIANVFSWILAVAFAYVTNRKWVFANKSDNILKEIFLFCSGRVATLVMEEAILFLFVTCLHFNGMLIKVIGQVLVIIANYVISKVFVFKK